MAETPQGNPFDPGVFNFASIMEDFYSSSGENATEDERLQKSAFQGNLVQTGFDAMLASSLAEQNSAIAQENMTTQAMLEKSNAQDLMKAEFGFNELSKESNFGYENSFANAQYDRDIGMLAATGEQQRDNIREQSDQDRLSNIVQGEQQRLTDAQNIASQEKIATGRYAADNYQADRAADASMFGATESRIGAQNVAGIQATSAENIADTQTQSAERISTAQLASGERVRSDDRAAEERSLDKSLGSQENIVNTQTGSAENIADKTTSADKAIAKTAAGASMYGARRSAKASEQVAETQAGASMYGSKAAAEAQLGSAAFAADASKYGSKRSSEAQEAIAKTQRRSAAETTRRRARADERIGARSARAQENVATTAAGASNYGADTQLEGVKDTNKTSTENIRVTGDETRTTMGTENRLKAKDRADMSRYSRGLARAN